MNTQSLKKFTNNYLPENPYMAIAVIVMMLLAFAMLLVTAHQILFGK